jgi:hypothetical protein
MHGGLAALVDEAAVERITSLPSFLLGSTFYGIEPLVKYQCVTTETIDADRRISHATARQR